MQNFSSIGKRFHARKKIGSFFWHTLYILPVNRNIYLIFSSIGQLYFE